jgi:hypothetical protein
MNGELFSAPRECKAKRTDYFTPWPKMEDFWILP